METKTQQLFGLAVSTAVRAGCPRPKEWRWQLSTYDGCREECFEQQRCRIAPDIPWNEIPFEKKNEINMQTYICTNNWCKDLK